MSRKTIFRSLLALTSLALSLVAAEGGLRLYNAWRITRAGSLRAQLERSRNTPLGQTEEGRRFHGLGGLVQPSYSEELVYELKPNIDGYFKGGAVRTNSWGFRSAEAELAKPQDTFRIVGLGDSFMFGWGVHQEETYLVGLEEALNARGGARFEVLNLAVPGYNTALEVEAFAVKGVAFQPDLVVIHFFSNDLRLPYFMLEPEEKLTAHEGFYLVDLVRSALDLSPEAEPPMLLAHDRIERQGRTDVQTAYRHMEGTAGYRRAMARLAGLARELSIPVVVILLDDGSGTGALVRDVVAEEDLHLLEPRPRFLAHLRASQKDDSHWRETFQVSERDAHFNRLGHALLAEALVAFLSENQLVPAAAESASAGDDP